MLKKEEIEELNRKQLDNAENEHRDFIDNLQKGICYLCNSNLYDYNVNKLCIHWLLRPNGIKKHDYKRLFNSNIGFFSVNSYLRWLANSEKLFGNINNLRDEIPGDKIVAVTIKYKNIEWSLSCSRSDFVGHSMKYNNYPHYHMQMTVNGSIFIKFSDYHIPFNESDLFQFKALTEAPDLIKVVNPYGEGIQDTFDWIDFEKLLDLMKTTDKQCHSTYKITTFIEARSGEKISGDDIARICRESQKTGIPIAALARKINAKVKVIIHPSDDVPIFKDRKKRKR
jgi:hypothetical protein